MAHADARGVSELREIVCADLEHIRTTWSDAMDAHTLRREATLLRRLALDNGGDIARLWKLEDRPGTPLIAGSFDLLRLPTLDGLALASAETITLGGVLLSSLMFWEAEKVPSDESLNTLTGTDEPVSIQSYLAGACLVSDERPVRRSHLITYVANKRGANHYDRKRKHKDPRTQAAHLLLDELSDQGFKIQGRDAVFAQFLAIGVTLSTAPDVVALCEDG